MKRLLMVGILLLLSGCNLFPEPASLIQAPQHAESKSVDEVNPMQVAKGLLPADTQITIPNEPVGMDAVLQADFNLDGEKELVTFYKSRVNANDIGALVLQKSDGKWQVSETFTGVGYDIDYSAVADVTGDSRPELLVGWTTGVSAGDVLDVYTWEDNRFKKLTALNYHKLDMIAVEGVPRLAIWNRVFADVYEVNVVKWDVQTFVTDTSVYPSYFLEVADYYRERTEQVPDAAYYWYYLADAWLKAGQPEAALDAINHGMQLRTVAPSFSEFEKLKAVIESEIAARKAQDMIFYSPKAELTLHIPNELVSDIVVEEMEGNANEYVMNVYVGDESEKGLLFAVEVYAKDFIVIEELDLPILAETENLVYLIRRSSEHPFADQPASELYSRFNHAVTLMEEMIASVRPGATFSKHTNLDDALLVEKIVAARQAYSIVGMGGQELSGELETFLHNGTDYRYMGSDLATFEKLYVFLGETYTPEATATFVERAGIIEHDGRLAQPNADGGSLLNYAKASVLQVKDWGAEKQVDLEVPLGNSLSFETIQVVFQKTEQGWRIASSPGMF